MLENFFHDVETFRWLGNFSSHEEFLHAREMFSRFDLFTMPKNFYNAWDILARLRDFSTFGKLFLTWETVSLAKNVFLRFYISKRARLLHYAPLVSSP